MLVLCLFGVWFLCCVHTLVSVTYQWMHLSALNKGKSNYLVVHFVEMVTHTIKHLICLTVSGILYEQIICYWTLELPR